MRRLSYAVLEEALIHVLPQDDDGTASQGVQPRRTTTRGARAVGRDWGGVELLLRALRDSVSAPLERLPTAVVAFAAEALPVLLRPAHSLFPRVSQFILRRPFLDLGEVPMLYPLLLSGTDSWRADRLFLLRLLRFPPLTDGDLAALRKRHIPSLLLSNLDSFTADAPLRAAAIQALAAIADTRQGAVYLVQHASALSSLRILAATLSASPFCTPFTLSCVGGCFKHASGARRGRPSPDFGWAGRIPHRPQPATHTLTERVGASSDRPLRAIVGVAELLGRIQSRLPIANPAALFSVLNISDLALAVSRLPIYPTAIPCQSRSYPFNCVTPLAWKGDMTVVLAADWSRARAGARA